MGADSKSGGRLQRRDDLIAFLKKKSRAAIIEKNPYLEVLGWGAAGGP